MKKYLSVLMSVLLVVAFMPTFAALSLAVDQSDVLYYEDFDDPNFDSDSFISRFVTDVIGTSGVASNKTRNTELDNGYFRIQCSATSGSKLSNTQIGDTFDLSGDATKRKIIMEYRFRYLKLTSGSLASANTYLTTTSAAYDSGAFVDFRSGAGTPGEVYPDKTTCTSAKDGDETAQSKKAGTIGANTWGTITILYDEANPQRTIYVNGGEGVVAGNDLNSAAVNRYYSSTEFKPRLTIALNRVSKQVDFDYINIYKVPETFSYTLSETDARSAKVTFNTMPDPSSITASAFTVDGSAATSVTRVDGVSNTYIVEFNEVSAGNHVFDVDGVYAAGEEDKTISDSATNFSIESGEISVPTYEMNYIYNYGFDDVSNLPPVSDNDGKVEFLTDEDGNDVMRMSGVSAEQYPSLSSAGISKRPKVLLSAGTAPADKTTVVEFKLRGYGFSNSPMFESLRFNTASGYTPGFLAYRGGICKAATTDYNADKIAPTAVGEWHTVSVIYSATEMKRRILVDGVTLVENVTDNYNASNNHYGSKESGNVLDLWLTGYFYDTTYFDFDYIRAYTIPNNFKGVPAEVEGVSTGSIVADFSSIPDVSTLNAANITITDSNDDYVSSAYFKSFAGEERKYNLIFSERLEPNTTYKITFENIEDIDGNVIDTATYEFETGEAEMEYIDLYIDDEIPEETVAKLYAANQLDENKTVTVMIAAYVNEGSAEKMVKFSSAELTINKNTGNVIYSSPAIDVSDIEGSYTLKAFAWAGDSGMSPVLDCVSK